MAKQEGYYNEWARRYSRLTKKYAQLQAKNEKLQETLEEIKTAAGKSQRDVFYYLKADKTLKEVKDG